MSEIQIVDGLDWVRSQGTRFFRSGSPTEIELSMHVLCDAVYARAPACLRRWNDWWLISSSTDWMHNDSLAAEELFQRVVPAPEQGANSMRGEVVLLAFATDVALFGAGGWKVLKGDNAEELTAAWQGSPDVSRAVAFRLEPSSTK